VEIKNSQEYCPLKYDGEAKLKDKAAMNDFHYLDQQLWCEKVAVSAIAEQVGTPFIFIVTKL